LISTILSLRTKDQTTAQASDRLFKVADTPEKILKLSEKEIEELIYPVGFYRNKAKIIKEISNRIGLVKTKNPEETEFKLMEILPKKYWKDINFVFVAFGQTICKPIKPKCKDCPIVKYCEYDKKS
jgi:endonuclease-3